MSDKYTPNPAFRSPFRFPVFFIFLSFLVLYSCEQDAGFLGRDLLPDDDVITTTFISDLDMEAYTEEGVRVITSENNDFLLGSYRDPVWGYNAAEFLTRFGVAGATVSETRKVDSLVLYMAVSDYYALDSSTQTLYVYEVTGELEYDSLYYSDFEPDGWYNQDVLLATATLNPNDSLLRIPLNNQNLLDRFSAVDDTVFQDVNEFFDFFKGLYVTTEPVANGGGIYTLDMTDAETEIRMHYIGDFTDTLRVDFFIAEIAPRVNIFRHDYTGSRLGDLIAAPEAGDSLTYIASMSGVYTKITFPGIESWLDSMPIAINKAELYIPVADSFYTGISEADLPARINLLSVDEDDDFDFIYDFDIDASGSRDYYGGDYSQTRKNYVFNMGRHLQAYLNGEVTDLDLVILPNLYNQSAERAVLKGPSSVSEKIRLDITYTKIQ